MPGAGVRAQVLIGPSGLPLQSDTLESNPSARLRFPPLPGWPPCREHRSPDPEKGPALASINTWPRTNATGSHRGPWAEA